MDLDITEMRKEMKDLGVDEKGTFARSTRRQVTERQMTQRRMLEQQASPLQTSSERTRSVSHRTNNETDIDDCYSHGENDGPYDGGQYDDEDDFIEADSCSMGRSDSSFRSDDIGSRSCGNSISIQTINNGSTDSGINRNKKRPIERSPNDENTTTMNKVLKGTNTPNDENTSTMNKVLKGTNIKINTAYKTKYSCDVCDFSSNSAKDLSEHYLSEQHLQVIEKNTDKIKFKCDFCKLRTKSRHDFVRHVLESKKHKRKVKNSADL